MDQNAPPPALRLTLKGGFAACARQAGISGLSRRDQALLAYLSRQGEMRAEGAPVCTLLWSDRSEGQARASLRQELSVLRRRRPMGTF